MKTSSVVDSFPIQICHSPQYVAVAVMGDQLTGKKRSPPIVGATLVLTAFLVYLLMGGRPPGTFDQVSHKMHALLQSATALSETRSEFAPEWATICQDDFCLEGPNLKQACVMQPSHFFLHMPGASRFKCYGRAAGPAGIFQLDMTVVDQGTVRVDFTPQQEGVYKLWISSDLVLPWIPSERPVSSIFTPWLHQQTLPMPQTLDLTVLPNPKTPVRGCKPCRGPGVGTLPGQWVNRTELTRVCGANVLGAMEEWVDDDFVWAARECTFPFYSRAEFLEHFAGASILLAGDSTFRGHFTDLQNWLWYGNGPETLQGPYETYGEGSGTYASSWDDHVSSFNTPLWGFRHDMLNITPNPMEVGKVRIEYFPVTDDLYGFESLVRRAWENKVNLAKFHYHATVLNYGLWGMHLGIQFSCQIPAFFRNIFRSLICRPKELRNSVLHPFDFTIPPEQVLGSNKCSWRDFDPPGNSGTGVHLPRDTCLERFPGRLVYRSGSARFEWSHVCVGNHTIPRNLCQLDKGIETMVGDAFKGSAWDAEVLMLDMFDISTTRPDRSLDGYHFFPRKCLPGQSTEKSCNESTWNPVVTQCCFKPNFPQIVSSTTTNMLIGLLWDDPLLKKRS
ncbi:hypothetical protein KFL_005360020 [Klebsormidium nitens]|uniref:Uncharacterized protein n=1 Tax=Klebsormidium nitens TaxID=105231 RepID=A0A1Y1IJD6_KLENI|nr:hypothetical protein KFL_005360020 [Klebsormidium nitens]|eukprot:GAQ89559.1 hypothetical protein KFL_005360020 [Klebsormidium nitens]